MTPAAPFGGPPVVGDQESGQLHFRAVKTHPIRLYLSLAINLAMTIDQ